MSKRDPRGPLLDMRAYALAAIRIAGTMMLDELRASELARLALERALAVIGVAANRVPKETRDAPGRMFPCGSTISWYASEPSINQPIEYWAESVTQEGAKIDATAQLLTGLRPISLEMSTSGDATTIKIGIGVRGGIESEMRIGLVNVGASHSKVAIAADIVAKYGGPEEYGLSERYGNFIREYTIAEVNGLTCGSSSGPGKDGPTCRQILGEH